MHCEISGDSGVGGTLGADQNGVGGEIDQIANRLADLQGVYRDVGRSQNSCSLDSVSLHGVGEAGTNDEVNPSTTGVEAGAQGKADGSRSNDRGTLFWLGFCGH